MNFLKTSYGYNFLSDRARKYYTLTRVIPVGWHSPTFGGLLHRGVAPFLPRAAGSGRNAYSRALAPNFLSFG